jgi:hypothetical protein
MGKFITILVVLKNNIEHLEEEENVNVFVFFLNVYLIQLGEEDS